MEAKVPTLVHPHGGNPCSLSIVQKWLDRCFQASTHSRSSGLWLPFAQGIQVRGTDKMISIDQDAKRHVDWARRHCYGTEEA